MTASPGFTYNNDILGNRLKSFKAGNNPQYNYTYRADGLRIRKAWNIGAPGQNQTIYRYDGQMGVQEADYDSTGAL